MRYTSLTIPEFEVCKGGDGRFRVRFVGSLEGERRGLERVGEERRGDYVRWRRWSAVAIQRQVEGFVGRRRVGFGKREIRGLEEMLKGVHQWCYRM